MRLFNNQRAFDPKNLEVSMKVLAALHLEAEKRGDDKAEIAYGFNCAGREDKWIKITVEATSKEEAEAIFNEFKERVQG